MPEVMLEVVPLRTRYVAFFKQVKRQERENRKKPPSLPSAVEDEEDNEEEEEGGSDDEAEVAAKKAKPNDSSSMMSTSGSCSSALASATRFRWPVEKPVTWRSAASAMPKRSFKEIIPPALVEISFGFCYFLEALSKLSMKSFP